MAAEVILNCKIIDDEPHRAYIEADIGRAWFDRSEFTVVSLGYGDECDQIRIVEKLAIERGIT